MKIINLLNKMAETEEIPAKIKYDGRVYTFDHLKGKYYENETCSINWDYVSIYCLNEEVEIIGEDNLIQKIKSLNNVGNASDLGEFKDKQQLNNHILKDKINEIIIKLNSMGD